MHPEALDEDLVVGMMDDDGNITQFGPLETMTISRDEIVHDSSRPLFIFPEYHDLSFTAEITSFCRGARDVIVGRRTMAAYRFIRKCRRHKEKLRRIQMKERMQHADY